MDPFYTNLKAMPQQQRVEKIEHIIGFLRQHNALKEAMAFQLLRDCYPTFPFFSNELKFREYLAVSSISEVQNHRIVQQILAQG
jgi:hypothetical protein